jgi:hypothetical protein
MCFFFLQTLNCVLPSSPVFSYVRTDWCTAVLRTNNFANFVHRETILFVRSRRQQKEDSCAMRTL